MPGLWARRQKQQILRTMPGVGRISKRKITGLLSKIPVTSPKFSAFYKQRRSLECIWFYIQTKSELNAVINELEEEKFQNKRE